MGFFRKDLGLLFVALCLGAEHTTPLVQAAQGETRETFSQVEDVKYYHAETKPREYFLFFAEGLGTELRKRLGRQVLDLLADEARTRPGDYVNFVMVPDHELICRFEIPEGSTRSRLHRSSVKTALRKLGAYFRSKDEGASLQCDPVRITKSVVDLHRSVNSACYVIIAADPLYTVEEDPNTDWEESAWNFEQRFVPSMKALEESSGSPFSVGKTKLPKATIMTWIAPTAKWSKTAHMGAVENFYRWLWLEQDGFLLRINGSPESCFDLVRPQEITVPRSDGALASGLIDTHIDVFRPEPEIPVKRRVKIVEQPGFQSDEAPETAEAQGGKSAALPGAGKSSKKAVATDETVSARIGGASDWLRTELEIYSEVVKVVSGQIDEGLDRAYDDARVLAHFLSARVVLQANTKPPLRSGALRSADVRISSDESISAPVEHEARKMAGGLTPHSDSYAAAIRVPPPTFEWRCVPDWTSANYRVVFVSPIPHRVEHSYAPCHVHGDW